jgi:hypothetical protein
MRKPSTIWMFLIQFSLGVTLLEFALCYVVHLTRRLPLSTVLSRGMVIALIMAAFGPLLYWARTWAQRRNGDLRPLSVVAGATGMTGALAMFHCASQLGLLSAETARGYSITALIAVPPCTVLAYYVNRNLQRQQGEGNGEQGSASKSHC